MDPLSPSDRTTVTRLRERAATDRAELLALLADGLVAHVAVVVEQDGARHPVVLPTAYAVDPEGPDRDGTLYLHGSVGAGWLRRAPGSAVCVTVTELDGLVLARSGFHHSMNYRSAVVIGEARQVTDPDEKARALDLVVDQVVPGRAATLRPPTRRELAATDVLAVALHEASLKRRAGGVGDEPEDIATGAWAGVVPLRRVAEGVLTDSATSAEVPDHVSQRVEGLR